MGQRISEQSQKNHHAIFRYSQNRTMNYIYSAQYWGRIPTLWGIAGVAWKENADWIFQYRRVTIRVRKNELFLENILWGGK